MSCVKSLVRAVRQTARIQTVISLLAVVGLTNPGITAQEIETQRDPMASNQSTNTASPRDDAASGIAELPKEVIFELGNPLLHQRSLVKAVTFSPDGKLLASCGVDTDSEIRLWDVSNGKLIGRLSPDDEKWNIATVLAFAPDGKSLVSGYREGGLGVWELATGKQVLLTKRHEQGIQSIAISPDGKLLATGSADGTIRISNLDMNKQQLGLSESIEPPSAGEDLLVQYGAEFLKFTPDGKYLLAGRSNSNIIVILRAKDGALVRTIEITDDNNPESFYGIKLQSLSLSQDGKKISAGYYRYIPRNEVPEEVVSYTGNVNIAEAGIWDFETGKKIKDLREATYDIGFGYSAVSPDGESVVLGLKGRLLFVNATTGETTREFPVDGWWGDHVTFSSDGQLVVATVNSTIGLWNVKSGKRLFVQQPSHSAGIRTVDYSPDGKRIVTSGDNRIHVWDALTGGHLFTRTLGPDAHLWDVDFSSDSSMIAVSGEAQDQRGRPFGTAVVWSAEGVEKATIQLPRRGEGLVLSPDGKRLVVAYSGGGWGDTRLELWSIERSKLRLAEFPRDPLKGLSQYVALKFSSDGRYILIAEQDGTVTKWDTSDEAADSSFVADWRPEDKRDSKVVEFRMPWLHHGDFTSDGKFLVTSTEDIYVWNVETGQLVRTIEVPSANHGFRVKVAPDNYTIAASQVNYAGDPGEDTLLIFDMRLRSGRPMMRLEPNDDRAYSFAFSPDSTRLVTGLQRGTALVWDLSRGSLKSD